MTVQIVDDIVALPGQYLTTASPSTNNLELTSSALVVIVGSNLDELTGMLPAYEGDGGICFVINATEGAANSLVIPHNDASSTEGYRFDLTPYATLTLAPQQSQLFFYVPEGAVPGWKPYVFGTFA